MTTDFESMLAGIGQRVAFPEIDVARAVRERIEHERPAGPDLDHLHLPVRNLGRSIAFYSRYFGFAGDAIEKETLFARNPHGFLLCLTPSDEPQTLPDAVHFGFTLPDAGAVRTMYEAMRRDEVTIWEALFESAEFVSFACRDPDGNGIEVYWEQGGTTMTATKLLGSFGKAQLLDPSVGQQFADALNARDFDTAAALISEGATWHVSGGPAPGDYTGPSEVGGALRRLVADDRLGEIFDVCMSDVHYVFLVHGVGEFCVHGQGDKLGEAYLSA